MSNYLTRLGLAFLCCLAPMARTASAQPTVPASAGTGNFFFTIQSNASSVIWTAPPPDFATITWAPATPGFTLQSTDSLAPANWVTTPSGANNTHRPGHAAGAVLSAFQTLIAPWSNSAFTTTTNQNCNP